jgi:hypothetical protein
MNTHLPYCKKGDWFCKNCANKKGWNVGIEGYALGEENKAPEHKTLMFEDSDADDFALDSKRLKRLKKVKR